MPPSDVVGLASILHQNQPPTSGVLSLFLLFARSFRFTLPHDSESGCPRLDCGVKLVKRFGHFFGFLSF